MPVTHVGIFKPSAFGGIRTTTLCGRVDNSLDDSNVADTPAQATCKLCVKARDAEFHPLQKWIGWEPTEADYR
ncbi:hypothetical protein FKG95_09145 [Denitrobaculum tricleocarpae]|uniref:Uncharacterized protein n=2 Tax=Denitrobaculum tricleocarpae TaxID=2591009 RepID=A0A545TT03_9PROT|nr:hypothetical protein FKG95_09145 [Denitrobaculum tricleocarpae]